MSDFKTVTLIEPVKKGDTEITEVQVRKPRAGELRGLQIAPLQMGDTNALIKLLPRITSPRLEENMVADLCSDDIAEFAETVSAFFTTSVMKAYQPT